MRNDNTMTTKSKTPAFAGENLNGSPRVAPLVDIYENQDEVLLVADLPGVAREDLQLRFENDQLTIEGAEATPRAKARTFYRTFTVGSGIDADKMAAELKAGVLKVHLPKAAKLKPRTIEIKSA